MKETIQHNWYAVIPAEILLDKKLSSTQKLLVALVSNLSNHKGYCYASNKYLGECLNLTSNTISDNISVLESKGIIKRDIVRSPVTKQIEVRKLKIIALSSFNRLPILKKQDTPIPKNKLVNNKGFNNKENNDFFIKKISI